MLKLLQSSRRIACCLSLPFNLRVQNCLEIRTLAPIFQAKRFTMSTPASDEEDADLKLAIALSLQESNGIASQLQSSRQNPVVIDDDVPSTPKGDETDANEFEKLAPASAGTKEVNQQSDNEAVSTTTIGSGFLGLDRAAMERERLGRKRKVESSSAVGVSTVPKRQRKESTPPASNTSQPQAFTKPCSGGACFPKGVVKKTWALGFPREDDIKIEEVLQPSDLQLAVLSSFQWDIEWLIPKTDVAKTKYILVMQAKEESDREYYRGWNKGIQNLRFCFPPMPGNVNCMHSKLMLLSHPTHLRVVVPTGNLVPYDWGETGRIENSVFLIDLPRLPNGKRVEESSLTPFGQELLYFCRAMGLANEVVDSLQSFDFEATKRYAFVHSIGGSHIGNNDPWRRTGYAGLGRAVSQFNLSQQGNPLRLDFVASSIGSIKDEFLKALYLAAQGDDGTTELLWRSPSTVQRMLQPNLQGKLGGLESSVKKSITSDFRIYFPSHATVENSKGGPDNAGTINFHEKWFISDKFPQRALHDCVSKRNGLLMHNKVIWNHRSLPLMPFVCIIAAIRQS